MKVLKRIGALALAMTMALTCLSGCQNSSQGSSTAAPSEPFTAPESVDLSAVTDPYLTVCGLPGDTVIATAGDTDITVSELLYWVAYSADNLLDYYSMYGVTELPWDQEVDGQTFADSIKQDALDTAALYALIPKLGEQEGAQLPEDFQSSFDESLSQMSEALGGEELMNHYLWQFPLTQELYAKLCKSEELNNAVMETRYGEGAANYPTDEDIYTFLEDDQQCYFFKHILFLVDDTAADSSADAADSTSAATDNAAEQKAKAEDILAQLNASDDPVALFDQLMNEYSEDGGLISYPDGYLGCASEDAIVGNSMVPVVEQAVLSLDDYGISGVLENTDGGYHGYHIVMRLPLRENVSAGDYRQDYISIQMDQLQQAIMEQNPVVTNEVYDWLSPADFYTALSVLRDAVGAEYEANSADASASTSASGSSASGSAAQD